MIVTFCSLTLSRPQPDTDEELEVEQAEIALQHKIKSQALKKGKKHTARLPRTAGLRTLSELTTELTAAGLDPSRIQERAEMLAKVAGQKRKRAREEEETMDVDMDGDDAEGDDDEDGWMDVDGEEAPKLKKVKGNSGAVVAVSGKREPRSNRQLMGMRDQGVSILVLLGWCELIRISIQQADKAIKLRNLGQRPRNMLAKAGESDRAIKVKMVSYLSRLSSHHVLTLF